MTMKMTEKKVAPVKVNEGLLETFLERWGHLITVIALLARTMLVNGKSATMGEVAEAVSKITSVKGLLRAMPVYRVIDIISIANRCGAFEAFGVELVPFVGFRVIDTDKVRSIDPWRRPLTAGERQGMGAEVTRLRSGRR